MIDETEPNGEVEKHYDIGMHAGFTVESEAGWGVLGGRHPARGAPYTRHTRDVRGILIFQDSPLPGVRTVRRAG